MSTNKEYRNHENGEDIMDKFSDIMDDIDDCKDDFRYLNNIENMKTKLNQIKNEIDWIIGKI